MEQVLRVFMEYAAAFEETYKDDDWARLAPFFSEDATYEVKGGPFACEIAGREAIFAGLRKSIEGFDRQFAERRIELTEGPVVVDTEDGGRVSADWQVFYQYREAPGMTLPGRSVFHIADGLIVAMRDEYDDQQLRSVGAWMAEYGEGLDGSYV